MRRFLLNSVVGAMLITLVCATGCNRTTPPPEPLEVSELPAVVEKAFAKAAPETKTLASQVVTSVQSQDYAKGFAAVQALVSRPGLSKEQVNVTSRVMLTVSSLLQAAQAKGDAAATRTLENYRRDK